MKYLRLGALVAAQHVFQMVQAFFSSSLFECLQENAGQESNPVGGAKIEGTLPNPIDRFFQQLGHVADGLQRNL